MLGRVSFAAIAASLMVVTTSAGADDVQQLAIRFGALDSVQRPSLSPDGSKLLYIAPTTTGGRVLFIADVVAGGQPKPVINANNRGETLEWCRFATETRIICNVNAVHDDAGVLIVMSRLVTMNADGGDAKVLSTGETANSLGYAQSGGTIIDWTVPDKPGQVLVTRVYVPEFSTGTHIAQTKEGVGVDLLDLTKLQRSVVERPNEQAVRYISDGKGTIRLFATRGNDPSGYNRNTITYLYRKAGTRGWETLVKNTDDEVFQEGEFWPVAVDSDKDVAYGFSQANGREALFSLSLDGQNIRQLILAHNQVDVDEVLRLSLIHI